MPPSCLQIAGTAAQLPHISVDLAIAQVCIMWSGNSRRRTLSEQRR
jgi:hypothetical protein